MVTKRLKTYVSGSIPGSGVSPVRQDTDLAPDIDVRSTNHDYSCSSNADPGEERLAPASKIGSEPVDNGW